MSLHQEDKNHLAMLTIPVILSMLLGFSVDALASSSIIENVNGVPDIAESREFEKNNKLSHSSGSSSELGYQSTNYVSEKKLSLQHAVENGNYIDFLLAATGTPFADVMTETVFHELVHRYNLQKEGYKKSPYTDF